VNAFSPRVILSLVLVGVFSFCALVVLFAYAPELRKETDPGAHALSKSAVGFAGMVTLLKADGIPVLISRTPPRNEPRAQSLLILTPSLETKPNDLVLAGGGRTTLIVMPKWFAAPQRMRPEWVNKAGLAAESRQSTALLTNFAKSTNVAHRRGLSSPVLTASGAPFDWGARFAPGKIDRLQTVAGEDWRPVLVDEEGGAVLLVSTIRPKLYLLADPDLLNTQGIADLKTAATGVAVIEALGGRENGVSFNVSLNGFARERSLLRLVLEPPLLAATLCAVAAALLMGGHALVRFGPTLTAGRAFALGKRGLVDNAAGLVRMAGREAELAPAYAALTAEQIAKAAGGDRAGAHADRDAWFDRIARLKGVKASRADLVAEAANATTRNDLLAVARKLYQWKSEMTREHS
jgi:hypothetical protein